ncbi:MAG TPA: hypothetical protein VGL74_12010 [Terriglobales bacterium]
MKLLALAVLALPTLALATTIDYASKGSIGAGTATLAGSATAGASLNLASPLIDINSVATSGTVTLATGTLVATSNPSVFDFVGGSIAVMSGGTSLFHSIFSSGSITLTGVSSFTISGTLNNGAAFTTQMDKHGDVQGDTLVTPESNTLSLSLIGTGMIALAAVVRKRSNVRRQKAVSDRS